MRITIMMKIMMMKKNMSIKNKIVTFLFYSMSIVVIWIF